jgi:hypothetical protein
MTYALFALCAFIRCDGLIPRPIFILGGRAEHLPTLFRLHGIEACDLSHFTSSLCLTKENLALQGGMK